MQDLVKATGVEKGGIYGHFSSKEELALEAFDFAWSETVLKRMAKLDTVHNAIEKLKLHIRNYTETPSFPGGCPWLNTAIESDDGNIALRDRARKALRGWEDVLVKIITDGQEAGEVRKDVAPQGVAVFLISTLEGATAVSRIDKRSEALAAARQYLEWFLEMQVKSAPL
jgi:TetR/AcrR family transcriptional repressor of nem operon